MVEESGLVARTRSALQEPRNDGQRTVSSTGIGVNPARFVVFHSKVVHFPVDAYDWRGTCKPISPRLGAFNGHKSRGVTNVCRAAFEACITSAAEKIY